MRRTQLEHAIRTACQIIGHPAVIIVGSQAILGTYDEEVLPPEATMSVEVDVLPIADSNAETGELADLIEGVAGEWSPFEEQHGFSIDGVDSAATNATTAFRTRPSATASAHDPSTATRPSSSSRYPEAREVPVHEHRGRHEFADGPRAGLRSSPEVPHPDTKKPPALVGGGFSGGPNWT